MDYHCAKLCLIILLFAVTAQPEKTTPEQLALPSVSCSVGRIRAVFGPQVKSNIHVKGEIAFFVANHFSNLDGSWQTRLESYK